MSVREPFALALPRVLMKVQIFVPHLISRNQNFSEGQLEVLMFNTPEDEEEPILRR